MPRPPRRAAGARLPYLPGLDGLRAVSVIAVLLYHYRPDRSLLLGGFLGVEVFFVISGYLITSLLVTEVRTRRRVDLRHFWLRRIRRLWPALIAMMLTVGYATAQLTSGLALSGLETEALDTGGALAQLGPIDKLVLAAGAGFHEELAFRVVLVSGVARLLVTFGVPETRAFLGAALGSALLFAFVHHLGPYGDALALAPFVFRTLAALYLTVVYAARGFAVAVYTHALYDVLVFFS